VDKIIQIHPQLLELSASYSKHTNERAKTKLIVFLAALLRRWKWLMRVHRRGWGAKNVTTLSKSCRLNHRLRKFHPNLSTTFRDILNIIARRYQWTSNECRLWEIKSQ